MRGGGSFSVESRIIQQHFNSITKLLITASHLTNLCNLCALKLAASIFAPSRHQPRLFGYLRKLRNLRILPLTAVRVILTLIRLRFENCRCASLGVT